MQEIPVQYEIAKHSPPTPTAQSEAFPDGVRGSEELWRHVSAINDFRQLPRYAMGRKDGREKKKKRNRKKNSHSLTEFTNLSAA